MSGASTVAFRPAWSRWMERARDELVRELGPGHRLLNHWASVSAHLERRLSGAGALVLLREFQTARAIEDPLALLDEPPALGSARFDAFIAHLRGGGWKDVFGRYPRLEEVLETLRAQEAAALVEFARRLDADEAEIASLLGGGKLGELSGVTPGLSDPHVRGRTVFLVSFATGERIVYKPRDGRMEAAWNGLLRRLPGLDASWDLRALRVLPREGRVWVEAATPSPCADEDALRRYYGRVGRLLSALYLVYGNDCHYENLVAAGEQPVVVDPETFLTPDFYLSDALRPGDARAAALHWLSRSVLMSGLLPLREGSGALKDVGGLAPAAAASGRDHLFWERIDTDGMDARYGPPPVPRAANLPVLAGVVREADGFSREILDGFSAGYRSLVAHRASLLAPGGGLDAFDGAQSRIVPRPSLVYALLLRRLSHPEFFADREAAEAELDVLARPFAAYDGEARTAASELVEAEKAALRRFDVPLVVARGADGLPVADGRVLPGVIAAHGAALARGRAAALGEADLERQLDLIRSALRLPGPRASPPPADRGPRPEELVRRAEELGAEIAGRAVIGPDGGACWVFPRRGAGARAHAAQDAGFSHGCAGTALFLAALARSTGDSRAADLALRAARSAARAGTPPGRPGLSDGLGGHVYALEAVGRLLGSEEVRDSAARAAARWQDALRDDAEPDALSGVAGLALGLLCVETSFTRAALDACAVRLAAAECPEGGWRGRAPKPAPLAGFAHGAAGISLALHRIGIRTGSSACEDAARRGVAYEDSLFRPAVGDWADLREGVPPAERKSAAGWCNGAPGIGLVRASIGDEEGAARAERATLSAPPIGGDTLCCGEGGRVEFLLVAGRIDEARRRAAGLGWRRGPDGWRHESPGGAFCPGFLQGAAGVGYALLRAADPDALPSALLFESASR